MFTHEADNAVERYRFGSVEVAFSYDEGAHDPMEDFDYEFCGIERNDRNSSPSDIGGWLHEYDTLAEEFEELEAGNDSWSSRDVDEVREHLEEYAYFEMRAVNEYGWTAFRIAIHKPTAIKVTGYAGGDWKQWARGIVDTYAQWAEGRVYTVGVEDHATGTVEYMGGIYDEPTEELACELAEELIGEFSAGVTK